MLKVSRVTRPPPTEQEFDHVAELLRQGRFLAQIAEDLDWDVSRVKRTVAALRVQVAIRSGQVWLDVKEKSPVAVAVEWQRVRASA